MTCKSRSGIWRSAVRTRRGVRRLAERETAQRGSHRAAWPLLAGQAGPRFGKLMKLQVKHGGGELTVSSQKEFLQLFNRGIIAPDDLVLRGDRWVPAGGLPWIRGMSVDRKHDNKRLFWITLAMMVAGLFPILWIQSHYRARGLPRGAVHAVPAR